MQTTVRKLMCWVFGHRWEQTHHRNGHEFDTITCVCNRCAAKHTYTTDAMSLPTGGHLAAVLWWLIPPLLATWLIFAITPGIPFAVGALIVITWLLVAGLVLRIF